MNIKDFSVGMRVQFRSEDHPFDGREGTIVFVNVKQRDVCVTWDIGGTNIIRENLPYLVIIGEATPSNNNNNNKSKEESNEDYSFFFEPQDGCCPCGLLRKQCSYHK